MPWATGAFSRSNGTNTGSTLWASDRDDGTKITAARHDTHDQDLADGINATVAKDGSNTYAVSSGTDTISLTLTPAPSSYTAGMIVAFKAGGTNTGAVTINVNSLGAKAIQALGAAISANDITTNDVVELRYDGTQFQMISPVRSNDTGIANVVEDTTPQLGGDLDLNGNSITGYVLGTDVQAQGAVLDDLNTLGANSADSEFLVGTGAGAFAWESGATALTSIGGIGAATTDTLTNKTIDADGTGNVITNIGSSEVKSELISGQTEVTIAAGDTILLSDADDSGNLKRDTVQGILDLVSTSTYQNLIINGDMAIAQRGTSFAAPSNNDYTLDRWQVEHSSDAVFTVSQDTDTPNDLFINSLKVDCTTADASIGAAQYAILTHKIEGLNCRHLGIGTSGAATVTASFWVKSPKTGAHYMAFKNSANDRSYPASYTVSSADTWEQKEVTVTLDTTGTWLTTNGIGLHLQWPLLLGTNYHGTADTWAAGINLGASDIVNCLDNTANNFFLTGVMLTVGSTAPSTFVAAGGSYGAELDLCKRYFERLSAANGGPYGAGNCANTTLVDINIQTYQKRTSPTFSVSADSDFTGRGGSVNDTSVTLAMIGADDQLHRIRATGTGWTAGAAGEIKASNTNSYMDFDAEL